MWKASIFSQCLLFLMYYSCLFTLATILIIVLLSVVVYSTQCRQFKIRAQKVKEDLESSVPGVSVTINPQKVMCIMIFARLCFVVYQNVLVVYPIFFVGPHVVFQFTATSWLPWDTRRRWWSVLITAGNVIHYYHVPKSYRSLVSYTSLFCLELFIIQGLCLHLVAMGFGRS
jgi:hypothetical protein